MLYSGSLILTCVFSTYWRRLKLLGIKKKERERERPCSVSVWTSWFLALSRFCHIFRGFSPLIDFANAHHCKHCLSLCYCSFIFLCTKDTVFSLLGVFPLFSQTAVLFYSWLLAPLVGNIGIIVFARQSMEWTLTVATKVVLLPI